jgi:LysM repeat protein
MISHKILVLPIILIFAGSAFAQLTGTDGRTITAEVQKTQEAVAKVLEDSGRFFREGLQAYKENRRGDAGESFDRSVEVFLYSTINVQRDQKLSSCYNPLIETIYRLENPTDAQPPRIRELSGTCAWMWSVKDYVLADEVIALAKVTNKLPSIAPAVTLTVDRVVQPKPPTVGFAEQQFEPSPLDDLAKKLELTADEEKLLNSGGTDTRFKSEVSRTLKTVKAQAGDTVSKIATRNNADAIEVAKFNGLLPNSPLGAGREIRLPGKYETTETPVKIPNYIGITTAISSRLLGSKPAQGRNGGVAVVMRYFNEYLNDPYSMRIVRWSPVVKAPLGGENFWAVMVKYRAKNLMGAYVLTEEIYYIRNDRVVKVLRL